MSNIRFLDQVSVSSFGSTSNTIDILQTSSLVLSNVGSINFEGTSVQVNKSGSTGVTVTVASTASSADSLVTASAVNNIITFTKGDASTFAITIDTGSNSAVDTGSFFTSASISSNILTFYQGSGATLDITLISASHAINADTASYVEATNVVGTVASASYALTASYALNAGEGSGIFKQTGSFYTTTNDLQVTGSLLVTGSSIIFDTRNAPYTSTKFSGSVSFRDDVIVGDDLIVNDETTLKKETTIGYKDFSNYEFSYQLNVTASSNSPNSARFDGGIIITGSSTIVGDITASANISSSETIRGLNIVAANQLEGNDLDIVTNAEIGGYLKVSGNVTSSNVSASGFISASSFNATPNIINELTASYAVTSSLATKNITTASVSSNDITFTKGDGTTFIVTVDTGSGGGAGPQGPTGPAGPTGPQGSPQNTGSFYISSSVINNTITFTQGDGTTEVVIVNTGSLAISSSYALTSSFLQDFSVFDGDRLVSNTNLPSGIYNNNFETTGSLTSFINAVFFPNSSPTLTSVTYSIEEFEPSGSIVGVVTASDAEGQTITFGTQSSYTDDYFRIQTTSGQITANTLMTTSLNLDTSQGYSSSLFPITLTDTFGGVTNDNIYIRVLPNAAPVWRTGGIGGNVITSATTPLSESSAAGSKAQYYFTDEESDTITIETGSLSSQFQASFQLQISSSFVRLYQTTASLDYETYPSYSFVLTASDEHYPSPDPNSVTYLPVTIPVVDNLAPTVDDQTLTGVSENSSDLTSAGTISVNNPDGDVITFVSFVLTSLSENGSNVPLSTYGGTSQTDPTENAFEVTSDGSVRRKSSVFINSDLIDEYVYTVTIRDNFNDITNTGLITIPISDDPAPSITDNWSAGPYIIESATDGDAIRTNSNGYSGTQADFNSNQSITWTVNPSSIISINSSGNLSLNTNLSGSTTGSGDTILSSVTASNSFGTTNQTTFTVQVTENLAPTATINANNSLLTSSLAISGSTVLSLTGSDPQGLDNIISASLSGTDANKFVLNASNGAATTRRYKIQPTASLEVGSYSITGSVFDSFGKSSTAELSFNIAGFPAIPDVFIYSSTRGQSAPIPAQYDVLLGDTTTAGSPIYEWASGSLGNKGPVTLGGGVMTLVGSASAGLSFNSLSTILTTIGNVDPAENEAGNHLIYIVYPSSSDLPGSPQSVTDSFGGSTIGEYLMYYFTDSVDKGIVGSQLNNFTISTGYTSSDNSINSSYTNWTVLGSTNSKWSSTSTTFYVVPSSGSAPA
tara:strand:- start:1379 stop:5167 length:3789 start_codon:yes stop_codon:yes gene_type:complete